MSKEMLDHVNTCEAWNRPGVVLEQPLRRSQGRGTARAIMHKREPVWFDLVGALAASRQELLTVCEEDTVTCDEQPISVKPLRTSQHLTVSLS